MPRDLLIPLLIPVLVVNAILVLLAARALFRRAAAIAQPVAPTVERRAGSRRAADRRDESSEDALPAPSPQPGTRKRGSGRFKLPPLDDDHERISRSIEQFLATATSNGMATGNGASPARSSASTATIAVVAIQGFEDLVAASGQGIADGVAAAVAETLRRAARGTDRVLDLGDGRACVFLPATGERAAASYLRRVHAACDPWLEAAAAPVRLVIATAATGRDGDLSAALRRAERRFERALANGVDEPVGEPGG